MLGAGNKSIKGSSKHTILLDADICLTIYKSTQGYKQTLTMISNTLHRFSAVSKMAISAIDGLKIYAEAIGDPSKPAIVYIHGVSRLAFCSLAPLVLTV